MRCPVITAADLPLAWVYHSWKPPLTVWPTMSVPVTIAAPSTIAMAVSIVRSLRAAMPLKTSEVIVRSPSLRRGSRRS